jgi:hypothetical protein
VATIRRSRGGVEVRLGEQERQVLTRIIDDLAADLGTAARTSPQAYDDPKLEAEYASWTRPALAEGRRADVAAVREAIAAGGDRRRLDEEAALQWLRVLNHLRLVAGARLGIDADGWEERMPAAALERDEMAMLEVLGWMQEAMIAAMDDGGGDAA